MNPTLPTLLVLASLLAAGCIEMPTDVDAARANDIRLPNQSGSITAEESVEESDRLCLGQGPITLLELPIYCATRVTTVTGVMTLTGLPFEVSSDVGDLVVTTSEEGTWSLVFTVTSSGSTAERARERLDETEVTWSVDGPNGHRVLAHAYHPDSDGMQHNEVLVQLALPAGAIYGGGASTSTGDVTVDGLTFESLVASTSTGDIEVVDALASHLLASSSTGDITVGGAFGTLDASASTGDVQVDAEIVDARLSTSTGGVAATLTPTATGRIDVGASTGDVTLAVPEDSRRGYRVEAGTSTGEVRIELQDGQVRMNEDRDEGSFTTSGFERRAIRTTIQVGTSTGDVTVRPA